MPALLDLWTGLTGVILPYGGTTVPNDIALMCYGQAVSRTTYARLFARIGITHGAGNGSTTFNLPDLRGRAIAGVDNMGGTAAGRLTTAAGGVNAATLGAAGGTATHTLTQAQLPAVAPTFTGQPLAAHGHPAMYNLQGGESSPAGGGIATDIGGTTEQKALYPANAGTPTTALGMQIGGQSAGIPAGTISNLGSGAAHPNVQPTMALNYIILI